MEIRGTFSTTISLLTSSTSSPSWWSDSFIQEMAFDDNNISDQSEIGLRSLQLDPSNTHLQKRHPGRTLDILKFKNISCHSCGADSFYTPPSRSFGPQFFCRCRFYLQCIVLTSWLLLNVKLFTEMSFSVAFWDWLQILICHPQTFGVSFLSLSYLSYGMNGYGMPNGKLLGRVSS